MAKEFDSEKQKNLDITLQQIDKQYGKGSIMRMGDNGPIQKIDVISTGALSLDVALGVGGVPRGRVVEIYGPESSGKTTLALTIIAQAQKSGGKAAIIDAEHALDPAYARALGVDIDDLLLSQPDTGEQALEIAEMLIRSGALDVVVIDSVAALVPKAEIEGEMGDSLPGLQARLMSQALRKLTAVVAKSHTCLLFINQLRMKIGVMFGNPETTTGGNALKFYSTVRMEIRKVSTIKDGEDAIGNRTRVKVVKNKVAPPFKNAEFDILYGKGIQHVGDVLDLAVTMNIVAKSGTWYSYKDERLGQGRDRAIDLLTEQSEMLLRIEKEVKHELGFFPDTDSTQATNGSSPDKPAVAAAKGKKRPPNKLKIMRIRPFWLIALLGVFLAAPAWASQIVLSTGYANSQRPEAHGFSADRFFDAGSGYAVGAHLDLETPIVWFGPSFLFWNNVTGDPDPDRESSYFQIELGGRLSFHTATLPAVYAGMGAGYTVARGDLRARFVELGGEYSFDGEFPTASFHIGAKSPTRTEGLGILAEASYHFGLDEPSGIETIGPAEVWMIQIGIALDTRFSRE